MLLEPWIFPSFLNIHVYMLSSLIFNYISFSHQHIKHLKQEMFWCFRGGRILIKISLNQTVSFLLRASALLPFQSSLKARWKQFPTSLAIKFIWIPFFFFLNTYGAQAQVEAAALGHHIWGGNSILRNQKEAAHP